MGRSLAIIVLTLFSQVALGSEFSSDYQIYRGDIDNDGDTDLYLADKSAKLLVLGGGTSIPVVVKRAHNVVLSQNANSTFSVISNLTPSQVSDVSNWPLSDVVPIAGDFNADGEIDIFLKGIDNDISGAHDQIVFAMSRISPSIALTEVDAEFEAFFHDLSAWMQDPDYFEDHARTSTQNTQIYTTMFFAEYCGNPGVVTLADLEAQPSIPTQSAATLELLYIDNASFIAQCIANGDTLIHYDLVSISYFIAVGEKDYSSFNEDALATSRMFEDATSGQSEVSDEYASQVLSSILEIPVDIFEACIVNGEYPGLSCVDATLTSLTVLLDMLIAGDESHPNATSKGCFFYDAAFDLAWGDQPIISYQEHQDRLPLQAGAEPLVDNLNMNHFSDPGNSLSIAHNLGPDVSGNQEYRGIVGGPREGWQLIYDESGFLVTDPANIGTWDYVPPHIADPSSFIGHMQRDVTPWVEWGNSPFDPTVRRQRAGALPIPMQVLYFCMYGPRYLSGTR